MRVERPWKPPRAKVPDVIAAGKRPVRAFLQGQPAVDVDLDEAVRHGAGEGVVFRRGG